MVYRCSLLLALGLWQLFVPKLFGITSHALILSEWISGILLIGASFLLRKKPSQLLSWLAALIGVWLQFSSLIFWAPTLGIYFSDLMVGALVIAQTIIFPISHDFSHVAPGWSYNPSTGLQRAPTAILALVGWASSFYMAAYQLHYIDTIWDPFFHEGTLDVITSAISKSFPVSDAGLGSMSYVLEFLLTLSGGALRWYRTPWMVVLFGILVVPLSLVSIALIILQPLVVGAWCTWCLITAVCMLFMAAFSIDEVVLVLQYLAHVKRSGLPFWQVFWKGSQGVELTVERREGSGFGAMVWGFTPTWRLILCALIGLVLLFAADTDIDSRASPNQGLHAIMEGLAKETAQ